MPNELVQINNTLDSSATDEALTAAQGKTLNDKKVTGSVGATAPTSANFLENNAVYFQYNATTNNAFMQQIINMVYPIGTYYWSSNSTSPQELFGGTWTPVTDKFVLAAGSTYTAGNTGGAATISYTPAGTVGNHTLTESEMPKHYHYAREGERSFVTTDQSNTPSRRTQASGSGATNTLYSNVALQRFSNTDWAGGSGAHNHEWTGTAATLNNMPPYEVAYCWKRTG